MKRRLVCLLLALALCLSLSVCAAAAEVEEEVYAGIPMHWLRDKDDLAGTFLRTTIDELCIERNLIGNDQPSLEEADVLVIASKNAYVLGKFSPVPLLLEADVLKSLSESETALAINTDRGGVVFPAASVKALAELKKDIELDLDTVRADGVSVAMKDAAAVKAILYARDPLKDGKYDGVSGSYAVEVTADGETLAAYAAANEEKGLTLEALLAQIEAAGCLMAESGEWSFPWAEAAKAYGESAGADALKANVDADTLHAVLEAVCDSLGDQVPVYQQRVMKDWVKRQVRALGVYANATADELAAIALEYTKELVDYVQEEESGLTRDAIYTLSQGDIRYKIDVPMTPEREKQLIEDKLNAGIPGYED